MGESGRLTDGKRRVRLPMGAPGRTAEPAPGEGSGGPAPKPAPARTLHVARHPAGDVRTVAPHAEPVEPE